MILLCPTVQHTGSYFLVKHLLAEFSEAPIRGELTDGSVIFDHLLDSKMERWRWLLERYPAISPMRDPVQVIYSWQRREKPLSDLESQFANLMGIETLILPIDSPCRSDHLQRLNDEFGLRIKSHWPVIHSKEGSPFKGTVRQLSHEGKALAREMYAKLDEFYVPPPGL